MNTLWNELNQRVKGTQRERNYEPKAIVVQRNEKNKKGEWITFEVTNQNKLSTGALGAASGGTTPVNCLKCVLILM